MTYGNNWPETVFSKLCAHKPPAVGKRRFGTGVPKLSLGTRRGVAGLRPVQHWRMDLGLDGLPEVQCRVDEKPPRSRFGLASRTLKFKSHKEFRMSTVASSRLPYKVKDLSLAELGRKKIMLAENE